MSTRSSIPAPLRERVWDHYIGREYGIGKCFTCNFKEISKFYFECGHVKSVACGGKHTLANLRPVCGLCNKSMGKNNLLQFKKLINQ